MVHRMIIAAVMLAAVAAAGIHLATPASAQSSLIIQYDATGNPVLMPSATLPESPAAMLCSTNAGGGIDCVSVTAPIASLVDANGDSLSVTVRALQADYGLEIWEAVAAATGAIGIDAGYRPTYTDLELSSMGALTGSLPGTLGSTYTEGSQFAWKASDGGTRTFGARYVFLCTGIAIDGTKRYCRFLDGAVDNTQDDAEMVMGAPCTKVRSISATVFDSAGTARSTITSPCTLTVGRSLDNSDSATLVTIAASAGSMAPTAPATTVTWTGTNEVSLWVQSTGSCGAPTRSIAFVVECY